MTANPTTGQQPFTNEMAKKMIDFVRSIGIEVKHGSVPDNPLIPGIRVQHGVMLIDENNLTYPGDILYQAGRIAILPATERDAYHGEDHKDNNWEAAQAMAAMCWAWAALTHLQIAPEVVFHNGGYKGQSTQIIQGYQSGAFMGLPIMQMYEMAYEPHQATARGLQAFPFMYKWTND